MTTEEQLKNWEDYNKGFMAYETDNHVPNSFWSDAPEGFVQGWNDAREIAESAEGVF